MLTKPIGEREMELEDGCAAGAFLPSSIPRSVVLLFPPPVCCSARCAVLRRSLQRGPQPVGCLTARAINATTARKKGEQKRDGGSTREPTRATITHVGVGNDAVQRTRCEGCVRQHDMHEGRSCGVIRRGGGIVEDGSDSFGHRGGKKENSGSSARGEKRQIEEKEKYADKKCR